MDEIVILLQAKPNKSELIIHGNKAEDTPQRHKWVRFPFICIRLERAAGADRRMREQSSSVPAPLGAAHPLWGVEYSGKSTAPQSCISTHDQALNGVNTHPLNTAPAPLAQQLFQTFPGFVLHHLEECLGGICKLFHYYHHYYIIIMNIIIFFLVPL